MGIESFLTSSAGGLRRRPAAWRGALPALQAPSCLSRSALAEAGFRVGADLEAYEPVGCPRCFGIGYRGRSGSTR